jgi:hypothetical protein
VDAVNVYGHEITWPKQSREKSAGIIMGREARSSQKNDQGSDGCNHPWNHSLRGINFAGKGADGEKSGGRRRVMGACTCECASKSEASKLTTKP